MKKYRVELTEDELKAVIRFHSAKMQYDEDGIIADTSRRIHYLTKKLKNDGPEISGDPRPETLEIKPSTNGWT